MGVGSGDLARSAPDASTFAVRSGKVPSSYPPPFGAAVGESFMAWQREVQTWKAAEGGALPFEVIGGAGAR